MESNQESGAPTKKVSDQSSEKTEAETQKEEVKPIDPRDHKRAIDDLHKWKNQSREKETRITELESRLQTQKDAELAKQEDFKSLAETYKQRWEDEKKGREDEEKAFFTSKKYDAIYASALKAGLRKEAESDLEMLNLEGVVVERTDHGRVLVHGVDPYVEQLQKNRPHWFKSKEAPRFNSGGARPVTPDTPKELTAKYMVQLERSDKKKYYDLYPEFLDQLKLRKARA